MNAETSESDPVFSRVCEASARLMGGAVPRPAMKELKKLVDADPTGYPWEAVVDRILQEPGTPQDLTKAALKSQRDWIARGGRETPGKGVKHKAKSFVAVLLARLIFLAILIPALCVLLALVKIQWPVVDIYFANGWLAEKWPDVFGPKSP